MIIRILLLCCSLTLTLPAISGEMYKWVDENGKVHFSDKKPAEHKADVIKTKAQNIDKWESSSTEKPAEAKPVVMYSTSWCGYCRKARNFFKQNNIVFIEKDIEKSASAKREHKALGGGGIPVILVNGKTLRGFSQKSFMRAFDSQNTKS